jgi:hypothetical protein
MHLVSAVATEQGKAQLLRFLVIRRAGLLEKTKKARKGYFLPGFL